MIRWSCLIVMMLSRGMLADEPLLISREAVLQLVQQCGEDVSLVLSGQNVGHANDRPRVDYERFVTPLAERTGHLPAIVSMDYGHNEIPADLTSANEPLIGHWQAGGLVMISMHPANPWTGVDAHDLDCGNPDDLFRPGTAVHTIWINDLERVARGLQQLQDAGVIVLWRPFHEMNGDWFWWGSCGEGNPLAPAAFRRLWRETYHYLTKKKGLRNLLWVYSPSVQYEGSQQSAIQYYPGDGLVDVVALDWYTDDPNWSAVKESYAQLAKTGKPIGLAEFGPMKSRQGNFDNRKLVDFFADCPFPWAFFTYWHSWGTDRVAIIDNEHAAALMQAPTTGNLATTAKRLADLRGDLTQSNPLRN